MNKTVLDHLYFGTPNSKDFFKHIQRFLEVGFWYWDRQTNHIHFSKKVLATLGIKSDDQGIAIDDFYNVVHPNDQKILRKAFEKLQHGKNIAGDLEFRIVRKGFWRWVRIKLAIAEFNSSGEVLIIIGKFSDIDADKYSVQPINLERKSAAFSFFEYHITKNAFQWLNPKLNILDLKTTGNEFFLFKELIPFVQGTDLSLFEQNWKQFLDSVEPNFSYIFTCTGLDRRARRLKFLASKNIENNIVEGIIHEDSTSTDTSNVKQRFLHLQSINQLMFFSFNEGNNVAFCNRYAEKITGYKLSELNEDIGFRKIFGIASDSYKRFTEYLKSGSHSKAFECSILPKDGTPRVISWSMVKVSDSPDEILVQGKDVTQIRLMELHNDRLRKRISSYQTMITRLLFKSTPENIYFTIGEHLEKLYPKCTSTIFSYDSKDNFITIEGIFGISQKQRDSFIAELGWNPVGRRFQFQPDAIEIFRTLDPYKSEKPFCQIADGYISVSSAKIVERNFGVEDMYTVGLVFEDSLYGGIVIFSPNANAELDTQPLGDIALLSSIAIKKMSVVFALNQKLSELKLLNDRKLELLSHVSHEIRTPLNAILGFSQLLATSSYDDFTKKQYIDIINGKGKALTRLINDIIDFNKIEKGELTIVQSNFNLNKVLKEIFQFYLNELVILNKDSVELKLDIPNEAENFPLFTDEGRLGQVLENLIDNALKFTERGTIQFGYAVDGNFINLYVHDTGIGIDPKMQEMIFEKYRQLNTFQTQGTTGLGLKITKEIVTLLNGEISVESELGVGTIFRIKLPVSQISPELSFDKEDLLLSERKSDLKNKVILIVDDEEANCLILEELISNWGGKTLLAKNGKEAVDLVNSINQTIDLILMDIRMPVMDGYAATMEIKQINPKIPIIAQTAYSSEEDRLKAEAAGCNGYITKPIETNVLSEVLEVFLNS